MRQSAVVAAAAAATAAAAAATAAAAAATAAAAAAEEEGLQGVFKQLRRNRHQQQQGCRSERCLQKLLLLLAVAVAWPQGV
jgi:Spy/CpxP family protein refolding chaperone